MYKKRTIVWLLLLVGPLNGVAFQLPKGVKCNAKFPAKIERQILKQTHAYSSFTVKVQAPARLVAQQQVLLKGVAVPQSVTPASISFLHKLKNHPGVSAQQMGSWFVLGHAGQSPVGTGFYDDPTRLAQHLNQFYQGQGVVVKSPVNGHSIKLYGLPVDGILYKPQNYDTPVPLLSDKHFVAYDLEDGTGHIMGSTRSMWCLLTTPGNCYTQPQEIVLDGKVFQMASGDPVPGYPAQPAPPQTAQDPASF